MRIVLLFAAVLLAVSSVHAAPSVGGTLPSITVSGDDQGLVVHKGDDASYARFNLQSLIKGKVAIVMHMAARGGAEDMGTKLLEPLQKTRLPASKFVPVVIVDLGDCAFGTCGLVKSSMDDEKPPMRYVLDEKSVGRKALRLPKESFSAWLVGRDGRVLKAKTGTISAAEAKAWLAEAKALAEAP